MKLLASDYDRTLRTNIKSLEINIKFIREFRKKGHKFMIITGRNFNSIKKQIDIFNIPYDYLSCNDGAILFDNNEKILDVNYLDIPNIELLINQIKSLKISSSVELYGVYDKIKSLEKVVEIFVTMKSIYKSDTLSVLIKEYKNLELQIIKNYAYIESVGGKKRSIIFLNKQFKFDDIIVVGDGINDYEMLKEYNGYKMLFSSPTLYLKNLKTTTSVKSLIKKHL